MSPLPARGFRATLVLAAAVASVSAFPAVASGASADPTAGGAAPALSATFVGRIDALQQIKASMTPAERKMDSRLAIALRASESRISAKALPQLPSEPGLTAATIAVDLSATAVNDDLRRRLVDLGATVVGTSTRLDSIRATVPRSVLPAIAAWPDIRQIAIATDSATTSRAVPPVATPMAVVPRALSPFTATRPPARRLAAPGDQGTVVSEADKVEAVDAARTAAGVAGAGVKVCVLSDGVSGLPQAQQAGELPDVDILPGQEGVGPEGTAMLEVIHDLAPEATLGFATAFDGVAGFADNIRALRFQAHCDVLVDDIYYYDESPFQDGPIAQAVNDVTADGALYFSAAGNDGNVLQGNAGNYEATFNPSGTEVGTIQWEAHDFEAGPATQLYEPLGPTTGNTLTLHWADPLGASDNDYDLYIVSDEDEVVAASQNVQDGTQDPYERLQVPSFDNLRVVVIKRSGAQDRYLRLQVHRGTFSDSADGLKAYFSPGSIKGHATAPDAFSIAAAPAAGPYLNDPANPSGPYPGRFTGSQLPEPFTSDGPRRVFFEEDGTPITPGDFTATGGTLRQDPDFTAADGVSTTSTFGNLNPFFGTSAAAPHAAAIAALLLSKNPDATIAEVRAALRAGAIDLAPAGRDGRTGYGVLMADLVLAHTTDTEPPVLALPPARTVEATGPNGSVVTYTATATDTIDGPITPACSPVSGSTFPFGSSTVSCTAVDAAKNTATGTFAVTVTDTTGPVITVPDEVRAKATSPAGATVSFVVSANDAVNGTVPVDCVPASGSRFAVGSTTVTCTASDPAPPPTNAVNRRGTNGSARSAQVLAAAVPSSTATFRVTVAAFVPPTSHSPTSAPSSTVPQTTPPTTTDPPTTDPAGAAPPTTAPSTTAPSDSPTPNPPGTSQQIGPPPPELPADGPPGPGELANTGADVRPLLTLAAVLFGLGVLLIRLARRRGRHTGRG